MNPSYFNTYRPNVYQNKLSFKSNKQEVFEQDKKLESLDEYFEHNYGDNYKEVYEPVELDNIFYDEVELMTIPSEKYYHHDNAFRDEELYNPKSDIKYHSKPKMYSIDDVPLCENLWQNFTKNNSYLDTDIWEDELCANETALDPWKDNTDKLNNAFKKKIWFLIRKNPDANQKIVEEIYKSSMLLGQYGRMEINDKLCEIGIFLYNNSHKWDDTEKNIMKNLKIPFYQSVYANLSKRKYLAVLNCLTMDFSNEEILKHLNKHYKD